jgi:hypothetical protein
MNREPAAPCRPAAGRRLPVLLLCVLTLLVGLPAGAQTWQADVCIYQATPGGIAMAVRAAREGLTVLLVNHNEHLGGILSSGLGVWDTLYEGKRSPIYDEVRQAILNHYRRTYGENSPQYRDALPGKSGHTNGKFEPRVAEKILTDLVTRERNITVLKGFIPVGVEREGALLRSVTLRPFQGGEPRRVMAKVFADGSYEGDLLPLAKVSYRVGREARAEFNEPHAGVIYLRPTQEPPAHLPPGALAAHQELNLRKFPGFQEIIVPASTGAGDRHVQAFNYRTVLTSDLTNRLPVVKPADYDPAFLKTLEFGSIVSPLPNNKIGWNRPQLVGPHQEYVEGDWAARRRVMDAHWNATMGLLWFLQHDESVSAERRAFWRRYGLAKDEFADNGHRPYEIYVREARRLAGRYVLTQHDAMLAPGSGRAPVHADSIAISEWYLDTHACTTRRVAGSLDEGKMMLHAETWPGQVPYRALLPRELDNLLVPVCLSATHVAWGGLRLEPTWMQIGEAAGLAAALAVKQGVAPARLNPRQLVRELCERRSMIAFFNDINIRGSESWIPAVQFFATCGFFADYNARMGDGLKLATARVWAEGFARLRAGTLDVNALARAVAEAERSEQDATEAQFAALLPASPQTAGLNSGAIITREEAIRLLWALLPPP